LPIRSFFDGTSVTALPNLCYMQDCSLAAEIDGTGPSIGVSQQLVQHDADCYSGRKPGCDSQWAHSRPTLEEELLSELQAEQQGILSSSTRVGDDTSATPPQRSPRSACPGDPSSGAAAQQKHGKARQRAGYRGGRSMVRDGLRDDAHPRIPLPAELESLQRKFQALNGVYSFMIMQHLQATWRNCNRAAQELLETYGHGDRLHADDLQAMALLAPDMIVIRDRTTAVAASSGHGGLANESGGNGECEPSLCGLAFRTVRTKMGTGRISLAAHGECMLPAVASTGFHLHA